MSDRAWIASNTTDSGGYEFKSDEEITMTHVGCGPPDRVNPEAQAGDASPAQWVLVLMNGLLDELARTRAHIRDARDEAGSRSISRCIDMLSALAHSLDFELGGNAVTQLGQVCDYCVACLKQAGRAQDGGRVDEVIGLVSLLRDAWQKVEDRSV